MKQLIINHKIRIIIFLILGVRSLSSYSFNDVWMYMFSVTPSDQTGDPRLTETLSFLENWYIVGEATIRGKVYKEMKSDITDWDPNIITFSESKDFAWWDWDDYTNNVFRGSEDGKIYVRQEADKIYADKQTYVKLLTALFPNLKTIYLAPTQDENEVLLYDFTLHEGDLYPFKDEVRVERITTYSSWSGVKKRVQWLSNGLIIVESVGCINSIGGLITYQNTEIETELVNNRRHVHSKWMTHLSAVMMYFFDSYGNVLLFEYEKITGIKRIKNESSYNPHYYDLSGRRLSVPSSSFVLPRGVYIKDGKKVMVK